MLTKEIEEEIKSSTRTGKRYVAQIRHNIQSFAQEIGRLTDDHGLILNPTSGKWRPPRNAREAAQVSRPGQLRRLTKGLWGF